VQETYSPIDGSLVCSRELATSVRLDAALTAGSVAFPDWAALPLDERIARVNAFVDAVVAKEEQLAAEITQQMGRPIRYAAGEIRGFADRGHTMLKLARQALEDIVPPSKEGFERFIRREPLGLVLVLAPWNYPWLCAVNTIVPALVAGNTVLLKHSDQTPLVAERLVEAGRAAGLPEGVLEMIHMSHELTASAVGDERVAHIAFTGSVAGGHAVQRAAASRFVSLGLELGGKDPAYVAEDADLDFTVPNLVEGAMFNSGQSCCGIERIYVHQSLYERFVAAYVDETYKLVLGDPTDPETTLGPVVRVRNAKAIQAQIDAAIASGAKAHIDPSRFPATALGEQYMAPQVLTDTSPDMAVVREETFGPVVVIIPVASDFDAVTQMNDSDFGLTASIWTTSVDRALAMGPKIETGTWFMNRCDALDPELAWVGVKNSGRGCTLSVVGYEHLTRPKSFHLRLP